MSAVPADLSISSRWILPMTPRDTLLENHTLIVRDGQIFDLLPSKSAAGKYSAANHVDRSRHLLMPGLINAHTRLVADGDAAAHLTVAADPQHVSDLTLLGIAAMLRTGTTCFCATGFFPDVTARVAMTQGMRAVIGMPIAEERSAWAAAPADYLTRALNFRDELSGHPHMATAFAPLAVTALADSTLRRMAMLADELDAGVLLALHESAAEVQECLARHGQRPIERLHTLGLLTPALTAINMVHVDAADIAMATHGGVAIAFCIESGLLAGFGAPPLAAWAAADLRLGMGTGPATSRGTHANLWSEMRLLALLARLDGDPGERLTDWHALAMATRNGAAVLGLDALIGTLEVGKWADLCCVALDGPTMFCGSPPHVCRLVGGGDGSAVSDVWVAGRHLLDRGNFTRLDWTALAARLGASSQS